MSMFSETISRKMKLASNKQLAERYERRRRRAREVQERRGRVLDVVNIPFRAQSNGLLDE
jgi:hypothetical protein